MKKHALPQFAMAVVTILAVGCSSEPNAPPASPSPDGTMKYLLGREDVDGTLRIVIEIEDGTGTSLYREVTPASVSDDIVWTARWDGNSRIVLERREHDGRKPRRYIVAKDEDGKWSGSEE